MYIVMNRFKIVPGSEINFENIWKNRDSHLEKVPGIISFNLIKDLFTNKHKLVGC